MSKTDRQTLDALGKLRAQFEIGRKEMYERGGFFNMMIPDMRSLDNAIKVLDEVVEDLRKFQQVEHEAVEYDRAIRIATGMKGSVGREPDGRDYNELFAILSVLPPKEKV